MGYFLFFLNDNRDNFYVDSQTYQDNLSLMRHRTLFAKLLEHLEKKQISLIIGARQTGKTTIMQQMNSSLKSKGKQTFFLSLEDPEVLDNLNAHPRNLFNIIPPFDDKDRYFVFIDEIQYLDNPTNFLKYHYDLHSPQIKLVVSGSSAFYLDEKFKDSLAGRKRIFTLQTLSFEEFLIFKNREEIVPFINSGNIPEIYLAELNKWLNEYLLFGGYPDVVLESNINEKELILDDIAESYMKKEVSEANLKSPEAYFEILRILSAGKGIYNGNRIGNELHISQTSLKNYVKLMEISFHISRVRPFHRNFTKELRKMPKIYFNDLGLRNYFRKNYSPIALRMDKGELLENYVFRRFLDFYTLDEIKFWRTQKKQEVDFIIQESKAYEVKFSEQSFKPYKYKFFQEKYPEINFRLIHYENVLKFKIQE